MKSNSHFCVLLTKILPWCIQKLDGSMFFLFVFFSRTQVSVVSWCFFCQSHSIRFNLEQTIKNLSAAFDGSVLKFSWNHCGQWFGRIIRWGLWRGSPFLDDNKFTTKLNLRMDSQGVCDWVHVYAFDVYEVNSKRGRFIKFWKSTAFRRYLVSDF